jgi:carbonic anhydrase/acetyltransferase-like protein (isoleucine patch superfamily)
MGKYTDKLAAMVKVGKDVFIAPNATLLGDITLGDNCSVWYGAVLRADDEKITIGDRTNIQDGVIFHTDSGYDCLCRQGEYHRPRRDRCMGAL